METFRIALDPKAANPVLLPLANWSLVEVRTMYERFQERCREEEELFEFLSY
jgi:hypothetical protein